MSVPAVEAAAPHPGSIHFFVELYTPPGRRTLLRAVHALEAAVRASLRPGLDHAVAHARLEWWRQEAERAAAGATAHPLAMQIVAASGGAPLAAALHAWAQATQATLVAAGAGERPHPAFESAAGGAHFALIAALLGADPDAARALGAAAALLHRPGPVEAGADAAVLTALCGLAPERQPALRPLLVWGVLALRRRRRGETTAPEHANRARRALLGDNWRAWRAARAADAGRIHRILEVRPT